MTSNQPYLLRAFYDWIVDNGMTPYVVVSTAWADVDVPMQYVKDGQIVLNISPSACINLSMDYEAISFQARFGGQPMQVFFPCAAVAAIYAKENGAGTVFTQTPTPAASTNSTPKHRATESTDKAQKAEEQSVQTKKNGKANLRIIK